MKSSTGLEGAGLTDIAAQAKWGLGTNPIMLPLRHDLMAYAVIKVFFSNLKRGGILLIQIAVGSPVHVLHPPGLYGRLHPVVQAGHRPVPSPPSSRPPFWWRGSWYSVTKPSWGLASCWPPERCPHRRGLRPGHHHQGQHHERRLHRPGRCQHHPHHCPGRQIACCLCFGFRRGSLLVLVIAICRWDRYTCFTKRKGPIHGRKYKEPLCSRPRRAPCPGTGGQEASGQTLSQYMTWLIQTFYENQNKEEHMMNTDKRTVAFQVPGEAVQEV